MPSLNPLRKYPRICRKIEAPRNPHRRRRKGNFLSQLRNESSLSRQSNPLSQSEVNAVVGRARALGLQIEANPAGMRGAEVTGRWAGVPHFKVANIHVPVQPGTIIPP